MPSQPAVDGGGATGRVLGLDDGDRRVLMVLICTAVALMTVHWYRLTQVRPQPIDLLRQADVPFQLDVNEASWVEWMQLDRIGETLARRIVFDREQNGPFQSVDDLRRVSGIGPKTLDTIRGYLTCRLDTNVGEDARSRSHLSETPQ